MEVAIHIPKFMAHGPAGVMGSDQSAARHVPIRRQSLAKSAYGGDSPSSALGIASNEAEKMAT